LDLGREGEREGGREGGSGAEGQDGVRDRKKSKEVETT